MKEQTILHMLSTSPTSDRFAPCLTSLSAGDSVVLMADACYLLSPAMANTPCHAPLFDAKIHLYAMQDDLTARGLSAGPATPATHLDLVRLAVQHDKSISW